MSAVVEQELKFDCEFCGALEGKPCVSSSGVRMAFCHGSRYNQAVAAGTLPLHGEG